MVHAGWVAARQFDVQRYIAPRGPLAVKRTQELMCDNIDWSQLKGGVTNVVLGQWNPKKGIVIERVLGGLDVHTYTCYEVRFV